MKLNLAPLDRALRLQAGLFLLLSPTVGLDIPLSWALCIYPIATAFLGVDPVYRALGLTSCTESSYMHEKNVEVREERVAGSGHQAHAT